ncbi:hypothetical protein [Bradyrhizobium sp. WSM1417]|uniref:DUF6894 family protein n=1 Tax=Bradyrhizobium sp. WSM1417 TaxID=754500 RepID=UPI00048207A6|nr:hypothetical protein [Bradyrhizobium sp. WSM1417]
MKFYFDIKDDFFAAVDEDGVDLPGPEAAEREAIAMATSIARDVASAKGAQVLITVRNEKHPLLELSVTVARKALR